VFILKQKKDLSQLLREKGYKITAQRKAVLDVVEAHDGEHLSSQGKYMIWVRKKFPEVGVATIYRTLPVLEELGFIYAVDLKTDVRVTSSIGQVNPQASSSFV
jgi:Fur family ferric uptake transcriptional regulator